VAPLSPKLHRHHFKLGNANDDCYPQEESRVSKWGLKDYGTFSALVFACFSIICCAFAFVLYEYDRRKSHGTTLTKEMEMKIDVDDKSALSKVGKDSVYSYFVTDSKFGWIIAFATVVIQIGILVVFIFASEPKLQDDTIDIKFTWKCPRDTDVCDDKSELEDWIWAIFCVLMFAFLAKDVISGSKLIYHSAKIRHSLKSRIRYFFGGMCLCWIAIFALYVSCCIGFCLASTLHLMNLIGNTFSPSPFNLRLVQFTTRLSRQATPNIFSIQSSFYSSWRWTNSSMLHWKQLMQNWLHIMREIVIQI